MTDYIVLVAIGALIVLVLTELIAAALPVLIVIAAVPPYEREGLARLIAACDSSRRLRLWPALRLAVIARRCLTQQTGAATGSSPSPVDGRPPSQPE